MNAVGITKASVFLICLGLISWQSQVCVQRYLKFHLNTEVTFEKSTENTFPAFTVCPAYHVAYDNTQLVSASPTITLIKCSTNKI